MRFLKYFALLPLLLVFQTVLAQAPYIVISNADSGPGTLRQGLLDAADPNRTTTFRIIFQLPGDGNDHANRTIRLKTALPNIGSKVIIDGSSQASWPVLGVSGAKIILEPELANTTFSALRIGEYILNATPIEAVEIYGLYLRNFAKITNLQNVNLSQGSGIVIDYRANNITIGAPGKGNVIVGNINGISVLNSGFYSNINPTKIKVQSNFIGLIYDGVTANPNVTGITGDLYDCNIDIGGDNTGEGNVIAANRLNVDLRRTSSSTTRFEVNVINNKIGVDYTGLKDFSNLPLFLSSSSLEISGLKVNAATTQLYVRNNIIGGNRTFGIQIANADFILTGNSIGTDPVGNSVMGNGIGVKLEGVATGTIGGQTAAETNMIANNNYGVETVSSRSIKITRNSFFCNKVFGIGKTLSNLQPTIQIFKRTPNYISGKATPNAEVELFYGGSCVTGGICEGKTYFKTVQAGSDGKWEHTGAMNGYVTATASLLNATTSAFATAELLPNEAIVTPVTCSTLGSITIPDQREGFTFSWAKIESNGTRTDKGGSQGISNLDVGTYEVIIRDGCKDFATQFEIYERKLTKPIVNYKTPECGETNFLLTGTASGNGTVKFEWFRANDLTTVIQNGSSANFPEGEYVVKATDSSFPVCALYSDVQKIKRVPAPKLKSGTVPSVKDASCGKNDGSITNIVLDDVTGTAKYAWYKHDPITSAIGTDVIHNGPELVGYPEGTYTVVITDDGACTLTITRKIWFLSTIAIGDVKPIGESCGKGNGKIPNVGIFNADTYEWIDAAGVSKGKKPYSPGMNIELTNLTAGTYILRASQSSSNCPTLEKPFTVLPIPTTIFTFAQESKTPATCGLNNGSINLTYSSVGNTKIEPTTFEWKDEVGVTIPGTKYGIKNLAKGNYYLYATDVNGCPSEYGPFYIDRIDKLEITGKGVPSNDGCSLNRGSITGFKTLGGLAPYTFKWLDENDKTVGYDIDLKEVGAGTYRLVVDDAVHCEYLVSDPISVFDIPFPLSKPTVTDIRVCYVSDIQIPIIGAEEGTYQLFASLADPEPLFETKTGIFKMKVAKTADYYIRRKLGSCYSEFTMVHVEVTHDNLELGNVMTPNGDGSNDTWMVKGLPDYKGNNIKIYTRSGQLVYESIGNYTKPFDGRFRGEELPAGVYFYVIDLRAECKPIGGGITLLR